MWLMLRNKDGSVQRFTTDQEGLEAAKKALSWDHFLRMKVT